jgi:hypothetical protein
MTLARKMIQNPPKSLTMDKSTVYKEMSNDLETTLVLCFACKNMCLQ